MVSFASGRIPAPINHTLVKNYSSSGCTGASTGTCGRI